MTYELTHSSIIPLIGGQTLGVMSALNNKFPEYILSYSPFYNNDKHLISYLNKKGWTGEYILLDKHHQKQAEVDIINAVPPCAGLSSLSMTSSAENTKNDWLYITAERILSIEKPKVFFGENAPYLATNKGEPVVNKLREIGQRNGYTLLLYQTQSILHGNPQKRPRTFYIFFREKNKIPIFPWIKRDIIPIDFFLEMKRNDSDPMNIVLSDEIPSENPWIKFCMHKFQTNSIKELHSKLENSERLLLLANKISETPNEILDFFYNINADIRSINKAKLIKTKVNQQKEFWSHDYTILKGKSAGLIRANIYGMINSYYDTHLTVRECLRIMRMPDDFILDCKNPARNVNIALQNVIVTTAEDIANYIVKYLNNELEIVNTDFLIQNNITQKFNNKKLNNKQTDLCNFFE
jgi:site-specific DNA-cytosine methylase